MPTFFSPFAFGALALGALAGAAAAEDIISS